MADDPKGRAAEHEMMMAQIRAKARAKAALKANKGYSGADLVNNIGRGTNSFISSVVGAPVDMVTAGLNLIPGVDIKNPIGGSQSIESGLENLGVSAEPSGPQVGLNKFTYNYARHGGFLPIPGGPMAAGGGAAVQTLTDNPTLQMLGTVGPSAVGRATQGLVRGTLRGSNPEEINRNTQALKNVGVEPDVATASQRQASFGIQGSLSRIPGGRGEYEKRAEQIVGATGKYVEKLADSLALKRDSTLAGKAVQQGIEQYVPGFQAKFQKVDRQFVEAVGPRLSVRPDNFQKYIAEQTAKHPDARNILDELESVKLGGLRTAIQKDVADIPPGSINSVILDSKGNPFVEIIPGQKRGALPLDAVIAIRTQIGTKLANASLIDDVNKGQWKAMYSALTKDIENAIIRRYGASSKELQHFQRRNKFYKDGLDRIDNILAPLAKSKTPEAAYKAAMSGSDEGATKLWALRRSVSKEQWDVVKATVVDNLAKLPKGRQNVAQNMVAMEVFIQNYSKLHPRAKAALFGTDNEIRASLDSLGEAADLLKKSGKVLANPAHSGAALVSGTTMLGGLGGLSWFLTGQFGIGTALTLSPVAAGAGAFTMSKAMTSPSFVKWLGQSTKLEPEAIAAHVARLGAIATREKDSEAAAFLSQAYISEKQRLEETFGTSDPAEFPRALRLAQIPQ